MPPLLIPIETPTKGTGWGAITMTELSPDGARRHRQPAVLAVPAAALQGAPRPTPAIPMETPYCSCKLTRARCAAPQDPHPAVRLPRRRLRRHQRQGDDPPARTGRRQPDKRDERDRLCCAVAECCARPSVGVVPGVPDHAGDATASQPQPPMENPCCSCKLTRVRARPCSGTHNMDCPPIAINTCSVGACSGR